MSGLLRRFLWTAYDHLGGLVLLNLVWTGLSLPWLLLAVLLVGLGKGLGGAQSLATGLLALEWVLCSPPTLLLFLAGRRWARDEEVAPRKLFEEWRRFAWRGQRLGLLVTGATLVLLVNIFFLSTVCRLGRVGAERGDAVVAAGGGANCGVSVSGASRPG